MTKAQPTTPLSPAQMKIRKDENDERRHIRQRVHAAQHKLIDACEHVLDRLKPAPAAARSRQDERRQFANLLGLPKLCAKRACRRSRSCQSEPLDCLRIAFPLLAPDTLAGLVARRKKA